MRVFLSKHSRAERYFWRSLIGLIISDLAIGLGFIFQAAQSSRTYMLIDSIIPLEIMGAVLATGAFIFLIGLSKNHRTTMIAGLSLSGAVMLSFSVSFILSIFTHTLTGFPAIILWGMSGILHLMAVSTLPTSDRLRASVNAKRHI